jgi:hypothetical protein
MWQALTKNSTLHNLNFDDNRLGYAGMQGIIGALYDN